MARGTKLVIVESPTKARKIQGYLGDGYTVMASVGHIRDLAQPSQIPAADKAKYGKFGVDVNDGFLPYYVINDDKRKTVRDLKAALKNASELYLATDEDREGEAIAWHLVQTLKPKVPVRRMVFHEITKKAILESLDHTRDVDQNMVSAQETRRILDRLYGYELSPVLWRKVAPKLSAGRVQSVATRLIVERERERMAFVPATYRDIAVALAPESDAAVDGAIAGGVAGGAAQVAVLPEKTPGDDGLSIETRLENQKAAGHISHAFIARMTSLDGVRLATSKDFADSGELTARAAKANPVQLSAVDAKALTTALATADYAVSSVESKPYTRRPSPPFTTSTLQQTAGNRLGMSSRAVMRAAQGLYENGYITYMRTDSVTLSSQALEAAREQVREQFGEEYLPEHSHQYATKTAGAQEAHEAIRPAGSTFRTPAQLAGKVPNDQWRLYKLIWQRTLASQMVPATGSTETVTIDADVSGAMAGAVDAGLSAAVAQAKTAQFQASGTVITFLGFMAVSRAGGDYEAKSGDLPDVREGEMLAASAVQSQAHQTQAQARYTEASLVKKLESEEIGRPSTYASIISTIIDRGYVYERGRALIPSWLAFSVTKLLEEKFPKLVDYAFTAQMENGLDEIAQGKQSMVEWLTRFYFGSGSDSAHDEQEATEGLQAQVAQLGDVDARAINTIEIGDGINVRVGRFGPYLEDTANLDAAGNPRHASIPDDIAPDELTVEKAREIIANSATAGRVLGADAQGNTVEVRVGRFGPYVALIKPAADAEGASDAEAAPAKSAAAKRGRKTADRPKMASLFSSMDPETITLEQALALLSLPRTVGTYEEADEKTGEMRTVTIAANNGRYGPYITKAIAGDDGKPDNRSLENQDDVFAITLEQAKEKFAQPKQYGRRRASAKPPLRELGTDPESGKPVVIKDGFYGVYITDGETNRTLPKQYTVESVTPEIAFELLAAKRAQGPTKRRRATKTARKSTAKKSATKKTTAKKATARATTRKAAK